MKTIHLNSFFIFAISAILAGLAGCGGGGSSSSTTVAATLSPAPAPATNPAPSPGSTQVAAVATLLATPVPPVPPAFQKADCPRLLDPAAGRSALALTDADARQVQAVLAAGSPQIGLPNLAAFPADLVWWIRSFGAINFSNLGLAVHEAGHGIVSARRVCAPAGDYLARYFFNGAWFETDLTQGLRQTEPYSIADQALPVAVKVGTRYTTYILQNGRGLGDDFSVLVDELSQYTNQGAAELDLIKNLDPKRYAAFLPQPGAQLDAGLGGTADFQIYMLAYLQSARLYYPATYATIRSQPNTLRYLQLLWSTNEALLVDAYPYTTGAGGQLIVSRDAIAASYSPQFLSELDMLGITHKVAADWSTTYLK